jgi:hypothetical protein
MEELELVLLMLECADRELRPCNLSDGDISMIKEDVLMILYTAA